MSCGYASTTDAPGAALLACLILAGCAAAPAEAPPEPAARSQSPAESAAERATPAAPPPLSEPRPAPSPPAPPVRLSIAAVGDMMLGTDYPEDRLPDDDAAGFLADVAPVLRAADLAFGNLEGTLVDGGVPAKECGNPAACYLFRSPTRYATRFAEAGFDALSLANNHALDFGEDGRSATMAALAAAGIAHSGREGDFATLEAGGLSVSFIAFSVTRQSNLLHDYERAADIVVAQAAGHDLVVVSFHGGAEGEFATRIPFGEEEYFGEPRGDVVRFARGMVDAGADVVFGHGPHVVRGMERYRDRLIAYSLGNFATYYGISVSGDKGVAPILVATVDETGRFVEGRLFSTRQVRPAGPTMDPSGRALELVRALTESDFRDSGLAFDDDGHISPTDRSWVRPTASPPVVSSVR